VAVCVGTPLIFAILGLIVFGCRRPKK